MVAQLESSLRRLALRHVLSQHRSALGPMSSPCCQAYDMQCALVSAQGGSHTRVRMCCARAGLKGTRQRLGMPPSCAQKALATSKWAEHMTMEPHLLHRHKVGHAASAVGDGRYRHLHGHAGAVQQPLPLILRKAFSRFCDCAHQETRTCPGDFRRDLGTAHQHQSECTAPRQTDHTR